MKKSKEIMIIKDGHGSRGKLTIATTDDDGKKTIDMTGLTDVSIIVISDLREEVDSIIDDGPFAKKKVAELLKITPRTIQYYTDWGLLVPVENPKGRGVTRKYSKENLFELLIIKKLTQNGYDLSTIKQIVKSPFSKVRVIRS